MRSKLAIFLNVCYQLCLVDISLGGKLVLLRLSEYKSSKSSRSSPRGIQGMGLMRPQKVV